MKLNVVITSTRPGRVGRAVGDWIFAHAKSNPAGFEEIFLTDLAELDLPIYNEPNHPRMQKYTHEKTKRWSQIVESSDAFVFVLPEYNFEAPPGFYNAIDYLYNEWGYKVAGIVSYGGISGGLRSAQSVKPILTTVGVMPIAQQVMIPNIGEQVVDGKLTSNEHLTGSADSMLRELHKWSGALRTLR